MSVDAEFSKIGSVHVFGPMNLSNELILSIRYSHSKHNFTYIVESVINNYLTKNLC